ncbi:MAG: hypothetical protein ACREV4_03595 [Gammaproteobacteria bacterium]
MTSCTDPPSASAIAPGAFLDEATRVIPFAAFALAENTQAFLPVFNQALMRRGLPLRLYGDNGANYRSQQLALICAKLGIALIHARAYQPLRYPRTGPSIPQDRPKAREKWSTGFAPYAPSC